jgi:hypothetical protein
MGTGLGVIGAGLVCMNEEVHLVTLRVDAAQDVHQPRFHAASIHASDDVQDAFCCQG